MASATEPPRRQRVRKFLLLISFLLFPITLYYFSPILIIQSASEGIVNGSLIVFALMFLSALFVGRLWCGWACPAGALQELGAFINDKAARGAKAEWIKWIVWLPWMGIIALLATRAGGYHAVDPFYQLQGGVTVLQEYWYMIYYVVIAVFLAVAFVAGRRAGCHYICWMAPFMIIGRWIRNRLGWPALRLRVQPGQCVACGTCTRNCPMSLDIQGMVQDGSVEHSECILCGTCVDNCPASVIRYSFARGV